MCFLKIHNHIGKNKKLDIKWEAFYKITKILGQGTAVIQKQNYNGHSKTVNFANLKRYHADKHLITKPQVQTSQEAKSFI